MLLPAGKEAAFVPNCGLITLWLCHDELVRVSGLRGFVDLLLRRIELAEQDVIKDRVVKQKGLLGNEPDLVAQGFLRGRTQVTAVDLYRTRSRIIQAQDQRENGTFTGATCPDQREGFSGLNMQGYVPDRVSVSICVAERHIFKIDSSLGRF